MAQGSHKTYADPRWEPKTCSRCGGKLTLEGPACLWGQMRIGREWKAFAYHLGGCPSEREKRP